MYYVVLPNSSMFPQGRHLMSIAPSNITAAMVIGFINVSVPTGLEDRGGGYIAERSLAQPVAPWVFWWGGRVVGER